MPKLKMQELAPRQEKVLVRVDFNVPMTEGPECSITDLTRIKESLPTLQYLLNRDCAIILMSHLGKPRHGREPTLSLAPCAIALSQCLNRAVQMAPDCIGPEVQQMSDALQPGQILLLENLRFHEAEENPSFDPEFAKSLAALATIYIDDAFGSAHRAHSSTTTITQYFPGKAALGYLMQKEIHFLGELLSHPRPPFFALLGGAKVSSKIGAIEALLPKINALFIGGAMAYTFLKAQGFAIGDSPCEEAHLATADHLIQACKKRGIPLHLPRDVIAVDVPNETARCQFIATEKGIPEGWQGVDIGPNTVIYWMRELQRAKTVFWNGPFGIFEIPYFAQGTRRVASVLSKLDATTIVGGGDSVAAIHQMRLEKNFTHLSTGGGASLEFIEKGTLPGIEALSDVPKNHS